MIPITHPFRKGREKDGAPGEAELGLATRPGFRYGFLVVWSAEKALPPVPLPLSP